jgi:hypothetical protein
MKTRTVPDLDGGTFDAPELIVTPAISRDEGIELLEYIADSPHVGAGGFHPNTVAAAKWALDYIAELESRDTPEEYEVWKLIQPELGGSD